MHAEDNGLAVDFTVTTPRQTPDPAISAPPTPRGVAPQRRGAAGRGTGRRGTGRQGQGRRMATGGPTAGQGPWSHRTPPAPSPPTGPDFGPSSPGPAHRRPGAGASRDVRVGAVFSAAQNVARALTSPSISILIWRSVSFYGIIAVTLRSGTTSSTISAHGGRTPRRSNWACVPLVNSAPWHCRPIPGLQN